MAITAGSDILASDFISTSAGAGSSGKVPKLNASGKIDGSFMTDPILRVLTTSTSYGDYTSSFTITLTGGTTYRYTWNGTGTNPSISLANFPIGSPIAFNSSNFSAGNNGMFIVTGVGTNYIEVTNASGVAESNKILGNSNSFAKGAYYNKPAGLRFIIVEVASGGASGGSTSGSPGIWFTPGGSGGGYSRKIIAASSLPASQPYVVGSGGITFYANGSYFGASGSSSFFGSSLYATGAIINSTGGVGYGGDFNITGSIGGPQTNAGVGFLGNHGGNGIYGSGYGNVGGPNGLDGKIVITEFY